MTVSLLHLFHSAQPDDPDATLIRPSNWNAQHALTGTPGAILGFDGSGNAISVTPSSGRITLLVDTTFYVATTGNDSTGDGSVGSPWLTLQHAANVVTQNYFVPSDLIETVGVTIQMADGTYPTTEITFLPTVIGLNVSPAIYGNLGDPTKVVLTCSADSYTVLCYGVWSLGYVTIANTNAPDSCNAIVGCDGFGTTFAAFLYLENVVLGNAGSASSGAAHQGYHFISNDGAAIEVQKLTITGTAKGLIFCKGEDSSVASFGFNHSTLTLSVDPLWTTGAIVLDRWGKVYWNPDGGVTGTSSGPQYQVLGSGILLIGAFLSETSIPGVTTGNNNGGFIIPTQGTQFSFGTKTGLTLGSTVAPTLTGAVNFVGKTSGTITLSAQDAAGTWTMKLPTTAGTNGYSLITDGSGNTSWANITGGGGGGAAAPLNSVQYNNPLGFFAGAAHTNIDASGQINVDAGFSYRYNNLPILFGVTGGGGGNPNNYFFGEAGNQTLTGDGNVGEGAGALASLTTGIRNLAEGWNALHSCTTGQYNAAFGADALQLLTTGQGNLAVGAGAAQVLISGSDNVAMGGDALFNEQTGSHNLAIGAGALFAQNGVTGNIGIGNGAGSGNIGGFANLYIGDHAGTGITNGFANTIIGSGIAGTTTQSFSVVITNNSQLVFDYNYTTASTNTFSLGSLNITAGNAYQYAGANAIRALPSLGDWFFAASGNLTATGTGNTGFGAGALASVTSGSGNVGFGGNAALLLTTGSSNVFIGTSAGGGATVTASNNIGFGAQALQFLTSGSSNVAEGAQALQNCTTASGNMAEGQGALSSLTTGSGTFGGGNNVAIGLASLLVCNADANTAVGTNAGGNCTGDVNVFIGHDAGYSVTSGNRNTFIGANALASVTGVTTGTFNTIIGANNNYSGTVISTGSHNLILGDGISPGANVSSCIIIGCNGVNHLDYNLTTASTWTTHSDLAVPNGKVLTGPSTTSYPAINIASGVAPTSPADGDYWYDGTHLNFRHAGTTTDILAGGGGAVSSVSGTGAITVSPTTGATVVSVATATTSVLGVVKPDGTSITISGGTISAVTGGSGNVTTGTLTTNGAVYASGATAIASTAALTNGQILIGSTGVAPVAATIATSGSGISVANAAGTITLANTGVTSAVAGTGIGVSGATGAVTISNTGVTSAVAGTGISVSGATGTVTVSLVTPVTVANGGSGAGTFTAHGLLLGEGTSAFGVTAAGASNQILIGQGTSADPIWATTLPSAALPNYTGDVTSSGTVNTLVNIPTGTPAVGTILHTNIAAPSAPAAGKIAVYTNTTNNILSAMNSGGTVSNTVVPDTGASNNFLTAISASGVISKAQPSFANLSGSIASTQMPAYTGDVTSSAGATVNTLVNIPTGVTAAGRILFSNIAAPATPSAGTVQVYTDTTNLILSSKNSAGTVSNTVVPATAGANQFATAISAAGVISFAQPSVSNLSGLPVTVAQGGTGLATLPVHTLLIGNATSNVANTGTGTANQILISNGASVDPSWATTVPTGAMPAYTGDVTSAIGTTVNTLASIITAGGPTGSSTVVPVITYDAKGRLTAVTTATIAAGTANVDPSPQRVVATTGGSTTMTGWNLVLDPAGALATYTVVLPASPTNGQIAVIRSSQPISSLSWTATPATAVAAPNTLAAGSRVEAIYISAVTSWYFGL